MNTARIGDADDNARADRLILKLLQGSYFNGSQHSNKHGDACTIKVVEERKVIQPGVSLCCLSSEQTLIHSFGV